MIRFNFGANWKKYAKTVTQEDVARACAAMEHLCGDIEDKSFLDAGCGSGIHSRAAVSLDTSSVTAVDIDTECVKLTQGAIGSRGYAYQHDILNPIQVLSFDVVYCWGVAHHTGDMWRAIGNLCDATARGGLLVLALYNDQGLISRVWKSVKRAYCRWPLMRWPIIAGAFLWIWGPTFILKGTRPWREYGERGMSPWYDLVDWCGGYPFEVSTPGDVFNFVAPRGFTLEKLVSRNGRGCNEYVFRKTL